MCKQLILPRSGYGHLVIKHKAPYPEGLNAENNWAYTQCITVTNRQWIIKYYKNKETFTWNENDLFISKQQQTQNNLIETWQAHFKWY